MTLFPPFQSGRVADCDNETIVFFLLVYFSRVLILSIDLLYFNKFIFFACDFTREIRHLLNLKKLFLSSHTFLIDDSLLLTNRSTLLAHERDVSMLIRRKNKAIFSYA